MYQTPIFSAFEERIASKHLGIDLIVLFGDNLSLREVFFEETQVYFKPDTPDLLRGYRHIFLKNHSKDSRGGFLSRVNLGIISELIRQRANILLIHGYDSLTSWIAVFWANIIGIKVIWRGEVVARGAQGRWKRFIKKLALRIFFKRCDALMYSCSKNKDYLKSFGVEESRMFFIPCAVDNIYFRTLHEQLLPSRDKLRSAYGINPTDFVVLFCARFTERKRPRDLIKAMELINDKRLVILFVGDGPQRKEMGAMAEIKGIRTIFTGFKNQSEVGEFYTMSDVAAVISSYDPSPKAMNEAMNFALPIIATDVIGTVPDLVKHGENGFVLKVGDVLGISEAIKLLAYDGSLARKMGQRSKEMVSAWNYERDVDGIINAIAFVNGRPDLAEECPSES